MSSRSTARPAGQGQRSPPRAVSGLEAHLGFWLRYLSNHVSAGFQKLVEAQGVSVSEWVALRHLYEAKGRTPADLIEALGMTKGAISKLLDRLESKGLCLRSADLDDGRSQRLALTKLGRGLVPKLAALADENDERFFGHLSAGARAALLETLVGLVREHGLKEVPTK